MLFAKILSFILNPNNLKFILLGLVVILSALMFKQCEQIKFERYESERKQQNLIALQDSVQNYKDKFGNSIGTIKGLRLRIDELDDSIQFEKSKPPVTIIEFQTEIVEKVVVETVVNDSLITIDYETEGTIRSSQSFKLTLPYRYDLPTNRLITGPAQLEFNSSLWFNATLTQDKKTNQLYVNLKSDLPNVKFTNATGILVEPDAGFKNFQYSQRKEFGLGFNLSGSYDFVTGKPFVYAGVGINYTPRFLQF